MMFAEVREAAVHGVETTITPALSLVYGDGGTEVARFAAGATRLPPSAGEAVTSDTVFDVASVTKVAATTAVLMRLVADGTVSLSGRLRDLVPEATADGAGAIEIRHLAAHASGYPAHIEFFRRIRDGDLAGADNPRDAIVRMAGSTPLADAPGAATVYSDLGFILLGRYLERATGRRLDDLTRELVTDPLAMASTRFVDLLADPPAPRPAPVAATEVCPYRGLVSGEVHDDNCHASGGIHGHAGLFSTAPDLGRLAAALLAACAGASGLFDPAVVRTFFATSIVAGSTRVLGWDRPAPLPAVSHAGDLWPRDGVGHLGFTGCALWLDPARGRYVALLTNRVHPSRDPRTPGILEVRRAVMDAVVRDLNAR